MGGTALLHGVRSTHVVTFGVDWEVVVFVNSSCSMKMRWCCLERVGPICAWPGFPVSIASEAKYLFLAATKSIVDNAGRVFGMIIGFLAGAQKTL